MCLTTHYPAKVLGRTDLTDSCAPFITQLVEVLNSIGYYIETTIEPGGCTTLTIHVARQPSQVLTRLEEI